MDALEIDPPQPGASAGDQDARYRAPALDKGLDIIELLASQHGALTRAEIASALGRSPGEVYRMLERLVVRGYVARSLEGDRYAITMKLFALAHLHPPLRRLTSPAQPLMDGFARAARQSCHLVAPDGDGAIVVAHASCPGNWEFGLRVGARMDLLGTGSGRMLLAFMAADRLEQRRAAWAGSPDEQVWRRLQPELARDRSAGYRAAPSREVRGIRDVSVPILAPGGDALAVLTCPYVERLDADDGGGGRVVAMLVEIARVLSVGQAATGRAPA